MTNSVCYFKIDGRFTIYRDNINIKCIVYLFYAIDYRFIKFMVSFIKSKD